VDAGVSRRAEAENCPSLRFHTFNGMNVSLLHNLITQTQTSSTIKSQYIYLLLSDNNGIAFSVAATM
jgi:lipoprotein signal peptidase